MSTSIVVPESGHLRNLPFKLTDQTAKKNLIAGAKRKPFEKDPKQKSTKILFSAGAYLEVVLPTIKAWSDRCGSSFSYGGLNIEIDEVKGGFEENSRHFDTKVVMFVDGLKVVIHSYNTTQNMKIDGKGYLKFIEKYLEPYYNDNIKRMEKRIIESNRKILNDLSKAPKTPVTRSTRYKPVSNFKCNKCDFASLDHKQLRVHKAYQHTASLEDSYVSQDEYSLPEIQHSTRDNSLCDQLMLEDMTATDISGINK